MRQFLLKIGLLSFLMIILGTVAFTQTLTDAHTITATLTGSNVVTPVETVGSGTVIAVLVGKELIVTGVYQDLSSPLKEASGLSGGVSISVAPPGEEARTERVMALQSVRKDSSFMTLPHTGGTSGTFSGVFTLTDEQLEELNAGLFYVQLNTRDNRDGELRGQLTSEKVTLVQITVENAASITHLVGVEVVDWVLAVTFSPDGSHLVSDLGDPSIVFWNIDNLTPLGEPLVGHTEAITSVVFSPDGTLLASAGFGDDRTIRFWDVDTREPLGPALTGHEGGIFNAVFSPDGTRLASFGWDGNLILWEVASQAVVANAMLDGHGEWSCEVKFSPDGSLLATGGENGVIHLWDSSTLELVADLEGHSDWSCAKAFSPDGSILATGDSSSRGQLIFWDVADKEMIGEPVSAHAGQNFFSLAFSPDGSLLASGGSSGFHLWDVASQEQLMRFPMTPSRQGRFSLSSTGALAFSPDGTLLAAGLGSSNPSGEVHLWGVSDTE